MARGNRPRIGITCPRRGGRAMWWFNWFAVWRSGGKPVRISPMRPARIEDLDGLVVGGGDDISMTLYSRIEGKPDIAPKVRIDLERDHLERDLVNAAMATNVPVLGICRGAQMINVALGGTLHADIYEVYADAPELRTPLPLKRVHIEPETRLAQILESESCRVNALHHQSVDRLGEGLGIVAQDNYDIVQAIEMSAAAFVIGVQWHPEFLVFDGGQVNLFRALVQAARERGTDAQATAYAATHPEHALNP